MELTTVADPAGDEDAAAQRGLAFPEKVLSATTTLPPRGDGAVHVAAQVLAVTVSMSRLTMPVPASAMVRWAILAVTPDSICNAATAGLPPIVSPGTAAPSIVRSLPMLSVLAAAMVVAFGSANDRVARHGAGERLAQAAGTTVGAAADDHPRSGGRGAQYSRATRARASGAKRTAHGLA